MSTYKELIKNFKRLLESWPGNHMSFARTPEWKSVFISIDSGTDSGLLDESPHGLQEHGEDCGVYLACGGDYLSDQAHL